VRKFIVLSAVFAGVSAFMIVQGVRSPVRSFAHPAGAEHRYEGDAGNWFQGMKPYCNAVEAETRQQRYPPPATAEGTAYSAACFALAGKIDRARDLILTVDAADRWKAAGIVFGVGHPVADAGDDLSAGPIMELVVEFWPNHYMALYHAGISRYQLGEFDQARRHLTEFLKYYDKDDGWTGNARYVLERLD
jgi:TolA-binding protein